MQFSVIVCLVSLVALCWILRASKVSLGLPVAYLASLLLIHVPGAIAHLLDSDRILPGRPFTEVGIFFTAVGAVCFVAGVALVHFRKAQPAPQKAPRTTFSRFCLIGGWFCTTIAFLYGIPSIGAVLQRAGPIWMLGIILALKSAFRRNDPAMAARWLIALALYPILMLLIGGFLSYGIAAVMLVLSVLVVDTRSWIRVSIGATLATIVGISVFLSYFEHRSDIRGAVWGGAGADQRIEVSMEAVRDISAFDPRNPSHLRALDARLNQNYFAGLAASRIASGRVDYLHGRSLWEGVLALVPRALWPEKPVVAGSPKIVSEMTGLKLSPTTSFGVGNVMEFQINFGVPGLIVGFTLFGLLLGWLDRAAAAADATGRLGQIFIFFLPAVALIQPNGSVVEMVSGAAAALAGGLGWRWAWQRWPKSRVAPTVRVNRKPVTEAL